jgi:hypothetical protein
LGPGTCRRRLSRAFPSLSYEKQQSGERTVLYLGEINDQQQAAWRKTLSVFDEQQQEYENLCLFPDDREIPADAVDALQVKLSGLELRSLRMFGNCWLACELWRQLGLASETELRKTFRFKELSMPEPKANILVAFYSRDGSIEALAGPKSVVGNRGASGFLRRMCVGIAGYSPKII